MLWYVRGEGILHESEILMIKKIAQRHSGRHTDGLEIECHFHRRFAAIELPSASGLAQICQRAFFPEAVPLFSFRLMIDRDDLGVCEELLRFGSHILKSLPASREP